MSRRKRTPEEMYAEFRRLRSERTFLAQFNVVHAVRLFVRYLRGVGTSPIWRRIEPEFLEEMLLLDPFVWLHVTADEVMRFGASLENGGYAQASARTAEMRIRGLLRDAGISGLHLPALKALTYVDMRMDGDLSVDITKNSIKRSTRHSRKSYPLLLSLEEYDKLVTEARTYSKTTALRDELLVVLLFGYNVKLSHLIKLCIGDVQHKNGSITLKVNPEISLRPNDQNLLTRYLSVRGGGQLLEQLDPGLKLFVGERSGRERGGWSDQAVRNRIAALGKRIGINNLAPTDKIL